MYRYGGDNVGMTFQLATICLICLERRSRSGKLPGLDIRQGNITLPVILALQDEKVREPLLEEIARIKQFNGDVDTKAAIALIKGSSGIQIADQMADEVYRKKLFMH